MAFSLNVINYNKQHFIIMKPQLEAILAKTALDLSNEDLSSNNSYFTYENGKTIEVGAQTKLNEIKELFDNGLNPLAAIQEACYPPHVLLINMIHNINHKNANPDPLISIALEYISKDTLSHLPQDKQYQLLEVVSEYSSIANVEKFFEKGLRLREEEKESRALECKIAKEGKVEFFEILKFYQPEFNFGKKYKSEEGNYSLSEIIADEMSYETDKNKKEKLSNLKVFIDTNLFHSKLDTSIENKTNTSGKAKI